MKKLLVLLISIILLTGCNKNEKSVDDISINEQTTELKKIDENQDKVFFNTYRKLKLNGELYELKIPTINFNSQDISSINLEMKSFVGDCYKNLSLNDTEIVAGNIVDYETFEYDKYVTVKQNYYFYYEGNKMSHDANIYAIDYSIGKFLSNEDILLIYDISQDDLFELLEKKINSNDTELTMLSIKNDGYKLFINNDGKLVIFYIETNDDDQVKKELILN